MFNTLFAILRLDKKRRLPFWSHYAEVSTFENIIQTVVEPVVNISSVSSNIL